MLTVEEIRSRRPREVVVARTLAIVATLLWAPIGGYLYAQPGLVAVLLVLYVFGSFGCAKGRQAARIMVTVSVGLLYVLLMPYCWLGFTDSYTTGPEYAVIDIAAVVLAAIGLVLLYRPSSNRYFHLVTAARHSS